MSAMAQGRPLLETVPRALARTPGILKAHVYGQPHESLGRRPSANAWSQTEILAHLADFEAVGFQVRVELILRGEPVPGLDPDRRATEIPYAAMDPFKSLDRFIELRAKSLERLRGLSPDQVARQTVHGELGEITLGHLLAEWVVHDLSHVRQLILTAAQNYLPETGPWRPSYRHMEIPPQAG